MNVLQMTKFIRRIVVTKSKTERETQYSIPNKKWLNLSKK